MDGDQFKGLFGNDDDVGIDGIRILKYDTDVYLSCLRHGSVPDGDAGVVATRKAIKEIIKSYTADETAYLIMVLCGATFDAGMLNAMLAARAAELGRRQVKEDKNED